MTPDGRTNKQNCALLELRQSLKKVSLLGQCLSVCVVGGCWWVCKPIAGTSIAHLQAEHYAQVVARTRLGQANEGHTILIWSDKST